MSCVTCYIYYTHTLVQSRNSRLDIWHPDREVFTTTDPDVQAKAVTTHTAPISFQSKLMYAWPRRRDTEIERAASLFNL